MADVEGFLRSWRGERSVAAFPLSKSPFGNRNASGVPGDYRAGALPRNDPRFIEGIEPGVRPLVLELVDGHGLVTYTSCEGHSYLTTDLLPVPRHAAVLLQGPGDATDALLRRACRDLPAVRCEVIPHNVWSGGRAWPATGLFLLPTRTWDHYFSTVDEATEVVRASLAAARR